MRGLRKEISMGFTRDLFPAGTHMCMIYDSEEERKKIIAQFLATGIAQGEQAFYLADTTTPEELNTWFKNIGVKLPEERQEGAFSIFKAESFFCANGKFVPSEMIEKLKSLYAQAVNAGYAGIRGSGEAAWVLKEVPGSDRFMEFESLINTISKQYPLTPICQYDANRFSGAALFNALKVHPLMIVQGQIVRNPYYITPQEFLENFRVH